MAENNPYAHPELLLNPISSLGFPFFFMLPINPRSIHRHPACSCNIVSQPHIKYLQKEFDRNFQPSHSGIHCALFLNDVDFSNFKPLNDKDKSVFLSNMADKHDFHNYSFGGWHSREAHVLSNRSPVPAKFLVYNLDLENPENDEKFLRISQSLVKQGFFLNSLLSQERVLQYDKLNCFHVLRHLLTPSRSKRDKKQRIYQDISSIPRRSEIFKVFESMVNVVVPSEIRTQNRWLNICTMSEEAWSLFQKVAFVKFNNISFRNLNSWELFSRLPSESISRVSRFFFQSPRGFPESSQFYNFIELLSKVTFYFDDFDLKHSSRIYSSLIRMNVTVEEEGIRDGFKHGFKFSDYEDHIIFAPNDSLYSDTSTPFLDIRVQAYGSHRFPHRAIMNLSHGNSSRLVILNEITEFGIFEIAALFFNSSLRYQPIVVNDKSYSLSGNSKSILRQFCASLCSMIAEDLKNQTIETLDLAVSFGYNMDKPATLELPRTIIPSISKKNSEDFFPFFTFHNESSELLEYLSKFSQKSFEDSKQSSSLLFLRYLASYIGVPIILCRYRLADSKLFCSDLFPTKIEDLRSPTRVSDNFQVPEKCLFVLQTQVGSETLLHCLFDFQEAVFVNPVASEVPKCSLDFNHEPSEYFQKNLQELQQQFENYERLRIEEEQKEKEEEEEKKKQEELEKKAAKEKLDSEKRNKREEEKKQEAFEKSYREIKSLVLRRFSCFNHTSGLLLGELECVSFATFPSSFDSDSSSSSPWPSNNDMNGSNLIAASISSLWGSPLINQYISFCLRGLNRLKPSTLFLVSDISKSPGFPKKFSDSLKKKRFDNWVLLDSMMFCAKPSLASIKKSPSVKSDRTLCVWLCFRYENSLDRVSKSIESELEVETVEKDDGDGVDDDDDDESSDDESSDDDGDDDGDGGEEEEDENKMDIDDESQGDQKDKPKSKKKAKEDDNAAEDENENIAKDDQKQGDVWRIKKFFLSNVGNDLFSDSQDMFFDLPFENKLEIFKDCPNVPFILYYITFIVESNQVFLDDVNADSPFDVSVVNLTMPFSFLSCLLPVNFSKVTLVTTCHPGLEEIVSTRNIFRNFSEFNFVFQDEVRLYLKQLSELIVSIEVFNSWPQLPAADFSNQFPLALMDKVIHEDPLNDRIPIANQLNAVLDQAALDLQNNAVQVNANAQAVLAVDPVPLVVAPALLPKEKSSKKRKSSSKEQAPSLKKPKIMDSDQILGLRGVNNFFKVHENGRLVFMKPDGLVDGLYDEKTLLYVSTVTAKEISMHEENYFCKFSRGSEHYGFEFGNDSWLKNASMSRNPTILPDIREIDGKFYACFKPAVGKLHVGALVHYPTVANKKKKI